MDPNERSCYCGLWDTSPETLTGQGLARGHCGVCSVCGKPGHTRHFPGASPVTGAWCDRDYRLVSLFHPLGIYGKYAWAAILVGGFLLYRLLRG